MKTMVLIAALSLPVVAMAADEHMHDHMGSHNMSGMQHDMHGDMGDEKHGNMEKSMDHGMRAEGHGQMQGMFMKKVAVDGYTVTFHVMTANEGMNHGGSHNLMVKIEKDGKALHDVQVNSKVKREDGKTASKMLMRMGDWFMNGYDIKHEGRTQLMVLFKTADGNKHFTGVWYPEKE